jgi:ribosome modulation factor
MNYIPWSREVYWEGFNAYLEGYSVDQNPYDDDDQREQWVDGWNDAAWDD